MISEIRYDLEYIFQMAEEANGVGNVFNSFENTHFSGPLPNVMQWTRGKMVGNTLMRLSPMPSVTDIIGSVIFSYNRYDLEKIGIMLNGKIALPFTLTTVHEALPYIRQNYGIFLYAEDIVDMAIDLTVPNPQITLAAGFSSIGWLGEVTLDIMDQDGDILLDSTIPSCIGSNYCPPNDRVFIELWTFQKNFSSYAADFKDLVLGSPEMEAKVLEALLDKAELPYSLDTNSPYSIANAKYIYHGPNVYYMPTIQEYGRILVLEMDSSLPNLEVDGTIIMHYNDDHLRLPELAV